MGRDFVRIDTNLCHMVEQAGCAGGARALRQHTRLAQDNAHVRFLGPFPCHRASRALQSDHRNATSAHSLARYFRHCRSCRKCELSQHKAKYAFSKNESKSIIGYSLHY